MQKNKLKKILIVFSCVFGVSSVAIAIASCSNKFIKPYRENHNFVYWQNESEKNILNVGRPLSDKIIFVDSQGDTNSENKIIHPKFDIYSSLEEFLQKEDFYLKNIINQDIYNDLISKLHEIDFSKNDLIGLFEYDRLLLHTEIDFRQKDGVNLTKINQSLNNITVESKFQFPINQNKDKPFSLPAIDGTVVRDYFLVVNKKETNQNEYKLTIKSDVSHRDDFSIVIKKHKSS